MKKVNLIIATTLVLLVGFSSCKDDEVTPSEVIRKNDVPEFFAEANEGDWGINQPNILKISSSASRILKPTDLDFNPTRKGKCSSIS